VHGAYDPVELSQCDGLICIASWQREGITDFAGKIAVVPNWVPRNFSDALDAATDQAIAARRARWSADEGAFVFGTSGRLTAEKNALRLVRAFRQAFAQGGEPVRLVIAGDGPQRTEIAQAAAGDARIVVAGAQEDMATHYLGYDAFVSVARFEPFGLAIIEAMAADCPLVLSRTRAALELATDRGVSWVDTEAGMPDDALVAQLISTFLRGRTRYNYDLSKFSEAHAARAINAFYQHAVIQTRA
jgi:glycosyltransferase involved in cell wall biosynthesis